MFCQWNVIRICHTLHRVKASYRQNSCNLFLHRTIKSPQYIASDWKKKRKTVYGLQKPLKLHCCISLFANWLHVGYYNLLVEDLASRDGGIEVSVLLLWTKVFAQRFISFSFLTFFFFHFLLVIGRAEPETWAFTYRVGMYLCPKAQRKPRCIIFYIFYNSIYFEVYLVWML